MNKTFAFAGDTAVGQVLAGRLQEAGFALAAGLASADFILTYCLASSQLEDVYLGGGGAIESAKEGCCLIDFSPSTRTFAKEVYAIARVNGLQALDAPLVLKDACRHDAFGDPANALVLVGGEDDAFDAAYSLLGALADDVRYMGDPGSGQLAKAITTIQQASSVVALAEAYALAGAPGVPDGSAADSAGVAVEAVALAVEAGLAPAAARKVFHAMADSHFHGTYSCRVLMAELTAVMNAGEEGGFVLPQAEACQRLLELFLVAGGGDLAVPAVALAYAGDEEGAPYGIDWSRAEGMYAHAHEDGHDHGHNHEAGLDGYDAGYDYDPDDYDAYDGFGRDGIDDYDGFARNRSF